MHIKDSRNKPYSTGFAPSTNLRVKPSGFTIVELLVVIVVIGILAVITIISYSGISSRATVASLQSDLANNSKLLKMYYTEYGSYPTTMDVNNCPSAPNTDTKYCLKSSSGNTLSYQPSNNSCTAANFALYNNKGSTYYRTSSDSGITTSAVSMVCPYGFIVVPGSSTYSTSDFCVMKYEAKADDNGDGIGDTNQTTGYNTWPANTYPISATRKLVSTAAGYPVANISQNTANTAIPSYTASCSSGCHLISEAEWMTIAQNVLSNPVNWSSGTVGTGYIYRGHSDNDLANALEASTNDNDGYYNTGNSSSSSPEQKRALTLTNGEVIWDFAGNVYEWTQGTIAGGQQPGLSGESAYAWKQWNNGSLLMNGLPALSQPSSTGISGISGWDSTKGIGQLYSNYGEAGARAFRRGGFWGNGSSAGVLTLILNFSSSDTYYPLGLRVAR